MALAVQEPHRILQRPCVLMQLLVYASPKNNKLLIFCPYPVKGIHRKLQKPNMKIFIPNCIKVVVQLKPNYSSCFPYVLISEMRVHTQGKQSPLSITIHQNVLTSSFQTALFVNVAIGELILVFPADSTSKQTW